MQPSSARPYVATAVIVTLALVIRLLMDPRMSAATPPLTLLLAVAAATWLYGLWPGLFAACAAVPISGWLMSTPEVWPWTLDLQALARAASFFIVVGVLVRVRRRGKYRSGAAHGLPSASSVISHELRAPLQTMNSWLDVLGAAGEDGPAASRAQGALRAAVERQSRLVDDLVDHARIESGQLQILEEVVDVRAVVQGCLEAHAPTAQANAVSLQLGETSTDVWIRGDASRVEQVFTILLANAIRHSHEGGVVEVEAMPVGDDVHVLVKDQGDGIPPEHLRGIFEPFRQMQGESGRSEGLGLGLWIADRLVVAHGGSLTAESDGVGQGATFRVSIPRAESSPSGEGA